MTSSDQEYNKARHAIWSEITADQQDAMGHPHNLTANYERRKAAALRAVDKPVQIGRGGEVAPPKPKGVVYKEWALHDTLTDSPDAVSVQASVERTKLLQDAGALEIGVDLADTYGASNSLEKMLCHQVAVCHVQAMALISKVSDYDIATYASGRDRRIMASEKLINLSVKLMGMGERLTARLQNMRTGGQQKMTVEHVHIHDGGQAIVGNIHQGSVGAESKKGDTTS